MTAPRPLRVCRHSPGCWIVLDRAAGLVVMAGTQPAATQAADQYLQAYRATRAALEHAMRGAR